MIATDNRIEKFISKAQTIPKDFGYDRDVWDFDFWGFTPFSIHRDSEILDESNWETISEDLMNRFPKSFDIMHTNHWLVGWADHLMIKVKLKNGKINDNAIQACLDWIDKLEDYSIADEDDYSEKEWEEIEESWNWWIRGWVERYIENNAKYFVKIVDNNDCIKDEYMEEIRELVMPFVEYSGEIIFDEKRAFEDLNNEFGNEVEETE